MSSLIDPLVSQWTCFGFFLILTVVSLPFLVTSLLPPYDVRVEPVSPTAIKVKWRINQLNDPKAVLAHVIIYVFFSEAQQGRVQREIVIFDNDDTEHVVSQLYGGTNYYINMCTYSVNGVKGAYSKVAIGKTLESGEYLIVILSVLPRLTCA